MTDILPHVWKPRAGNARWIELQGSANAIVRAAPMPDGRYLWQFRKVVSYADTVEQAKDYVEAGAEFFDTFRRNPYSA